MPSRDADHDAPETLDSPRHVEPTERQKDPRLERSGKRVDGVNRTDGMNRRQFLGGLAAASAATILPRHVLGGPQFVAPSDKLNIAQIGCGTQGIRQVTTQLATRDDIQITCVCDPNEDSTNYVDWSRDGLRYRIRQLLENDTWGEGVDGIRAGREVARQVLEAYYGKGTGSYDGIRSYADFRELFAQESDLDAAVIITPDHTHAAISLAALARGVAPISHKPVSNALNEVRRVVDTAAASPIPTHMLAYRDRHDYYTLDAWLKAGVIGPVREVHNWTNRPVWPQGWLDVPAEKPPVPAGFDWELWLGPERSRAYHPNYTFTLYRGWYDFGGGCFADMGNYSLWAIYRLLGLDAPISVEASANSLAYLNAENVAESRRSQVAYPIAGTVRFHHAGPSGGPPVDIFWYEGGIKPPAPVELFSVGEELEREGMLLVGENGKILCGYRGTDPRLLPNSLSDHAPAPVDPEQINIVDADDEWINAIRTGGKSPGGFDRAAALAEATALYGVAMRMAGQRLDWDSQNMLFTNVEEANGFVRRDYRPGWEI